MLDASDRLTDGFRHIREQFWEVGKYSPEIGARNHSRGQQRVESIKHAIRVGAL
jgi:hypothetical protein